MFRSRIEFFKSDPENIQNCSSDRHSDGERNPNDIFFQK